METKRFRVILGPSVAAACLFSAVLTSTHAQVASSSTVVNPDASLRLISDDFKFTEGPAVDRAGNVFFTDQPNDRIMKWSIDGSLETWLTPCGRSNGLFFDSKGNLLACADGRNQIWSIHPDKRHTVLLDGYEGKLFNGPNDLWIAPDGTVYFTDPYYRRDYWQRTELEPQLPKRVYRLAPDLKSLSVAAEGFKQPNGIVGDGKNKLLYVADIGDNKTYRFQINDAGELTQRSLFCDMGSDGMTLDNEGNLYLTGKGVTVFNPQGEKLHVIDVPENWTANVCFGGSDRKTLFITASDSVYTLQMRTAGL